MIVVSESHWKHYLYAMENHTMETRLYKIKAIERVKPTEELMGLITRHVAQHKYEIADFYSYGTLDNLEQLAFHSFIR